MLTICVSICMSVCRSVIKNSSKKFRTGLGDVSRADSEWQEEDEPESRLDDRA